MEERDKLRAYLHTCLQTDLGCTWPKDQGGWMRENSGKLCGNVVQSSELIRPTEIPF